jgi:hypothetical protein
MYGVWEKKWPEDWTPRWAGDYPHQGLIHFYAFLWEAGDRASEWAHAEGAKRLKAALIAHARIASTTSTYRGES